MYTYACIQLYSRLIFSNLIRACTVPVQNYYTASITNEAGAWGAVSAAPEP